MAKRNHKIECEHTWEHKETEYPRLCKGYKDLFAQVEVSKCTKCGEERRSTVREEESRNEPMWWR